MNQYSLNGKHQLLSMSYVSLILGAKARFFISWFIGFNFQIWSCVCVGGGGGGRGGERLKKPIKNIFFRRKRGGGGVSD